jgi:hypothetical protein
MDPSIDGTLTYYKPSAVGNNGMVFFPLQNSTLAVNPVKYTSTRTQYWAPTNGTNYLGVFAYDFTTTSGIKL